MFPNTLPGIFQIKISPGVLPGLIAPTIYKFLALTVYTYTSLHLCFTNSQTCCKHCHQLKCSNNKIRKFSVSDSPSVASRGQHLRWIDRPPRQSNALGRDPVDGFTRLNDSAVGGSREGSMPNIIQSA